MRIALLTRRFDSAGGGTERDLLVTAQCLRAAGHQVTIFADEIRESGGEWRVERVGGVRLGRALSLMRFAYAAAPAARRAGNDLVLSFARCVGADVMRSGGGAHVSYLRAARRWRSALGASSMRFSPYHQVQMLIERQAFRHAGLKRTVAVSNFVRDDLIREFGLARDKTVTIYNGVDLDRFHPAGDDQSERAAIRQKFVIPAGARVVIFVGNGFARKGLGFLLEAWPLVAGGAFLLVVGGDRATGKFVHRARELNVGARVVFAGPQPNVEPLFHAADAFALPSLFEPFGNVVMEAMASGLPAMTSAFSGVAELIPVSMRGFRVENPTDVGEIALRLGALFDASPNLGAEARAVAEKFTWDRYAAELNALLESVK